MTNLPKIALLMLRGIEGCGISTYARHFQAYYDEHAPGSCQIYAPKLKIGRGGTSTDLAVKFFTEDQLPNIVAEINSNYDAAFILSVPAVSGAGAWMRDGYIDELMAKLAIPRYLFNLDHHSRSIARNAHYDKAIALSDKVVCYSHVKTPQGFIRYLEKVGQSPKLVQLYNFYHVPLYKDLIEAGKERGAKKIICGSRGPYWKRASLLFNMAERLGQQGYICELMGFERSRPAVHQLRVYEHLNFHTAPDQKQPAGTLKPNEITAVFEKLPPESQDPAKMYAWGPYEHEAGMKRVSESAFSLHPRTFEHNCLCYGNNHEFQGYEAGLLSVPIFHRHFLETVGLPSDPSDKLSNYDFLLSIDDDNLKWQENSGGPQVTNFEELLDKMEDIYYNKYKETRETLVEFFTEHYSSAAILPKQLEDILA